MDYLCEYSYQKKFKGYVDLIERDLDKIVLNVAPLSPKGDINVVNTRKVSLAILNWQLDSRLETNT